MKAKHARMAAALADALEGIKDARAGLKEKPTHGTMFVELGAFENHGNGAGVGHGNSLIPISTGRKIIKAAEKIILEELQKLGVEP